MKKRILLLLFSFCFSLLGMKKQPETVVPSQLWPTLTAVSQETIESALETATPDAEKLALDYFQGMNPEDRDTALKNYFLTALERDRLKTINFILTRFPQMINVPFDKEGLTPLMIAIARNYELVVQRLLKRKNIDVNRQNAYGETALMIAVQRKNLSIIKNLLDFST